MPSRSEELDRVEEAVLREFLDGPQSFPGLVEKGVIPDRATSSTIRDRLLAKDLIYRVGQNMAKRVGRPRKVWALDRHRFTAMYGPPERFDSSAEA